MQRAECRCGHMEYVNPNAFKPIGKYRCVACGEKSMEVIQNGRNKTRNT